MPQRVLNIILAIIGICAVAALAVAGADAWAHARRGPRWWRRIVGAGLALVAMMGIGSCRKKPPVNTCYTPGALPAAQETALSLRERATILDEFAAAETLDRETTLIVLETIEDKLAILSNEAALAELSPDERAKAEALRDEVRAKIEAIRKKLGPAPQDKPELQGLEATDEWQTVIAAWREIAPLAETHKSTSAQRVAAKANLDAARGAITKLVDAGELSRPEAALLASEADRLQKEMYRDPPTDSHVRCYSRMMVVPARNSLARIAKRLPLLERLATSSDIHAAALAKVLPSIEADLTTLVSDAELKHLRPAERTRAETLAREMAKALAELKALVEDGE